MDTVSILFVLLISVMGAAIAYFADLLGRHIGKKRLKLFRWLRPKYTAAVLAAVAGFFIPLITVGVVYLLSQDVRIWLTEGRRAVAQRDQAIKERDAFDKQASQKALEVQGLTDKAKRSLENLDKSNLRAAKLNAQIAGLNRQASSLRVQVNQAKSQLANVRKTFQSLKRQYDALKPEYNTAVQTRNAAINQRDEAHRELSRLNNELGTKDKELRDKQKRLDDLSTQFKDLQRVSDERIETQTKQIAEGTQKLVSLESDIEKRKLELNKMESDLDTLNRTLESLKQGFGSGRVNPMIFAKGDELARVVIPASSAESEVRSALTSLVRTARSIASVRGAVDPAGGESVAGMPNPNEDTAAAIKKAAAIKGSMVLVAQSYWNAFKGESVPLLVEVIPNPVIYAAGKIIAETEIDGHLSDDAIIGAINEFVAKTLGPRAIQDGMIPAIGQDQTLGEIKRETVLALVRDIRIANRRVRLVALAANETRAADRLEIAFKIR